MSQGEIVPYVQWHSKGAGGGGAGGGGQNPAKEFF